VVLHAKLCLCGGEAEYAGPCIAVLSCPLVRGPLCLDGYGTKSLSVHD
jgi:hypothetical protein